MPINTERLDIANKVVSILVEDSYLSIDNGHICFSWIDWRGHRITKRWVSPLGSFYPTIRNLPIGGTHQVAITQLVNWVKCKNVLSLNTWEYWFGFTVNMKGGDEIIPLLKDAGYPTKQKCMFCGKEDGKMDWYTAEKKSGFGCYIQCRLNLGEK